MKNNKTKDTFQAFLVENAKFTKNEEYPIIKKRMISKSIPKKILPFNIALNSKEDLSETFICTYCNDETFERVRRYPKRYINFFKRCGGLIGFDFSVHTDMPIIKQKSQMNDNLSLTYYYGNLGIKIIPNIRYGIDEISDEFLNAIPKNSLVAIGTHGFIKENYKKAEWYCFLEKVINKLNPKGIVVYGNLNNKIFNEFKNKTKFYYFEPWIYLERKNKILMN